MNSDSGKLTIEKTLGGMANPSFLALNHRKDFLYAVSEIDNYEGKKSGAVYSYKIIKQNYSLVFVNKQSSEGAHPCHIAVDQNDRFVFVANYNGGNVVVLPINENGSLGKPVDIVNHGGSSVNKNRQEAPHAHSVNIASSNDCLLVSDLGIDKIMIYKVDVVKGKLISGKHPWVKTKPGAGPRHLDFGLNGKLVYSINELDNTISIYKYDPGNCGLTEIQNISTLPKDFKGETTCAEIVVSHDGRFVYGSNRGHDSIAAFSIDEQTGKLSLIQHQSTMGKTPRNFAIDPTGKFLLAANQNSDSIITFEINSETGKLRPTGNILEIPNPACLQFI